MRSLRHPLVASAMALCALAGAAALVYALWTDPIAAADQALAGGRLDQALGSYAAAQARFDRLPQTRQVFAADYDRVCANELWILFRQHRYDEVLDAAAHAPEGASPHLWASLALLEKGRAEKIPERQLGWLNRSEEESRRAVEAAPGDWDAKYDFELVTRLAAALRKAPATPPSELLQVLRPTPKLGTKPGKRIG